MNAFPSPEPNNEAVLAAIHSSAGTLCAHVGHWRRRPPGYLAVFSTFARLRPGTPPEFASHFNVVEVCLHLSYIVIIRQLTTAHAFFMIAAVMEPHDALQAFA